MDNAISFGQQMPVTPTVAAEPSVETRITPEARAQEQAWALAAQQGDQAAFMQIVDSFQQPVYNLCYRMLGDGTEAEDGAQETFLRAYTRLGTFNPERRFSSWLLSIASHYCIDRLRKKRYQIVSWDELPPWRWLPDGEPQPEQVALRREADQTLRRLLDTLPAEYRAATILRYWYDMSYDEIAETTNSTVSAIKSRLFRARQMLAKAADEAENGAYETR